jgi:hypothetical protein
LQHGGGRRLVSTLLLHLRYTVTTSHFHLRYTITTSHFHLRYTITTSHFHLRYTNNNITLSLALHWNSITVTCATLEQQHTAPVTCAVQCAPCQKFDVHVRLESQAYDTELLGSSY